MSACNIFSNHTRLRIIDEGEIRRRYHTSRKQSNPLKVSLLLFQLKHDPIAKVTHTKTHTHTDISHLGIYSRTKNCRQVENNWKQYQKALFDHYVILVMKRHRRDVTILKAKKEREVLVVIIIIIIVACNNVEDEKYNIMIPPLCLLFKLLILF